MFSIFFFFFSIILIAINGVASNEIREIAGECVCVGLVSEENFEMQKAFENDEIGHPSWKRKAHETNKNRKL